jgi:molybdopterin converting factor small subunit
MKVKVELWLWLGKELGQDFKSLSSMRSELEIKLEEDTAIGKLFDQLAGRYPVIGEKVFNREKQIFYENIVVTLNEQVISPFKVYETKLKEGDKITVLPVYTGG